MRIDKSISLLSTVLCSVLLVPLKSSAQTLSFDVCGTTVSLGDELTDVKSRIPSFCKLTGPTYLKSYLVSSSSDLTEVYATFTVDSNSRTDWVSRTIRTERPIDMVLTYVGLWEKRNRQWTFVNGSCQPSADHSREETVASEYTEFSLSCVVPRKENSNNMDVWYLKLRATSSDKYSIKSGLVEEAIRRFTMK